MKNTVLEEINRNRQLMGLSLITEQGVAWLDDLIRQGVQRFTGLDNIIKKLGLKGNNLTDADIDKIVDEIPVNGKIKDEIRQVLKNDVNVKNALKNNNENFLLQLKKSKNASAFNEVANLTADEVNAIVKRTVSKMLNDASSNLSIVFDKFDLAMTNYVENALKNSGSKLRNIDEIYDIAEANLQDILKGKIKNGMDFNVAEEMFNSYKNKLRTNSKLKTKLDEISSSGRNSNLPKRTKSIPDFNSQVDFPESLSSTKNWVDDTVPPVRDGGETPTIRDGGETPAIIDGGGGSGVVPEVTLTEINYKYPGFFAKYISNYTNDTLYNIFRSFFGLRNSRVYLQQVEELNNTLVRDFLPGFVAASKKITEGNVDQFSTTVRQLLMDLKLSKQTGQTWDQLWSSVKNDIITKGTNAGVERGAINEFISAIEKGGNSKSNIETFLNTMQEISNDPRLFPSAGQRFALNSKESIADWIGINKFFKESNDSLENLGKAWKTNPITKFVPQFLKEIWNWFSGFLLYQAPRTVQRILRDINYSGITNYNLIKTLFATYFSMLFASYFFKPAYDSLRTFADALAGSKIEGMFEWMGIPYERDEKIKDQSGFEILISEYKEKIKKIVDVDLGLDDLKIVGKGPIIEAFMGLIDKYLNESPDEAKNKSEQEFLKAQKEYVEETTKKNNEKAEKIWNEADKKQKKEILKKNGFDKYYDMILFDIQGVNQEQRNKMVESLDFIPGIDPVLKNELENQTIGDFIKHKKNNVPGKPKPKALIQDIKDISGTVVIKDRNGTPYKLTIRDGFLVYAEPSFAELEKNPDAEITYKRINTFVDKL